MTDAEAKARRAEASDAAAPPHDSALHALLPHILEAFRREPALALTAAYLLVALAGIYYDYSFYQQGFGIPVLTLSQIGDFLVAGLQQPVALLLMVTAFLLCWVVDRYNTGKRREHLARLAELRAMPRRTWWQERLRRLLEWKTGALWFTQLMYVVFVAIYGWWLVGWYAADRVKAVERGDAAQVEIQMNGSAGLLRSSESTRWSYLGAVSNYVFVYDVAAKQAMILPVNAIARLQLLPAAGRKDSPGPVATRP